MSKKIYYENYSKPHTTHTNTVIPGFKGKEKEVVTLTAETRRQANTHFKWKGIEAGRGNETTTLYIGFLIF